MKVYVDAEEERIVSYDNDDDDDGELWVVISSESGDRTSLPLHPQPGGRAQRHATPAGSTPSFPRATTITTSTLGGALHISMLSGEVAGGSQGKMWERWCVG